MEESIVGRKRRTRFFPSHFCGFVNYAKHDWRKIDDAATAAAPNEQSASSVGALNDGPTAAALQTKIGVDSARFAIGCVMSGQWVTFLGLIFLCSFHVK